LIAPRHPERAGGVVELARSLGLKAVRRSPLPPLQTETEVLVLDTVGELASLYQLAFVAFVGGSLVPKGGHNPIEPARFAVPVLSGPYVANFAAVYEVFCGQQGAFLVGNGQELGEKLAYFLDHPEQAQEAGQAAQAVLQAHTGATARTVDALEPLLS
jgi:3-deoxy-D-manno-octulosonic-acid transferase